MNYAKVHELPVKLNSRVKQGVSPVKGLYYLGLPWLSSRNSALLGGVGADARHLVDRLTNNTYPIK